MTAFPVFRRIALSVTVATLAGFGLSPAAHAATVLPMPAQLHTTPAPLGSSDDCGSAAPYGYIGLGDVTFYANATSPDNSLVQVEFSVTPDNGSAAYDYTTSTASGYNAVLTLPRTDFQDGATYTWKARSSTASGDLSDWSAPCHFVSDQTTPPAASISSSDFPASGSALPIPPMRQPGKVTFKVADPTPGDAVRFEWDLNSEIAAGYGDVPMTSAASSGTGWVPVNADGTATVTVTPTYWSNWIEVRTQDRAGNVSGTTRYTFSTTWNGPDVRGDLNGDKHPDLVATGKDGKLYVLQGNGDGTVQPAVSYADAGTDWYPALIAQNGDLAGGDGFQDIARINASGYMGTEMNNGLGDFNQSSSGSWYRSDGTDWSAATQIALLGPVGTHSGGGVLLSVEGGKLLSWQPSRGGTTGVSTVLDATFGNASVIAPGDLNGDGYPDFLVREESSGQLRLAASNPDGSFGAPNTWKNVGTKLKPTDFPLVTSVGDANGDGLPDLYAVTKDGGLAFLPGTAGGGFGPAQLLTTSGIDWTQVAQLA